MGSARFTLYGICRLLFLRFYYAALYYLPYTEGSDYVLPKFEPFEKELPDSYTRINGKSINLIIISFIRYVFYALFS